MCVCACVCLYVLKCAIVFRTNFLVIIETTMIVTGCPSLLNFSNYQLGGLGLGLGDGDIGKG